MFAGFLRFVAGLRCSSFVRLILFMEVSVYAEKRKREAETTG